MRRGSLWIHSFRKRLIRRSYLDISSWERLTQTHWEKFLHSHFHGRMFVRPWETLGGMFSVEGETYGSFVFLALIVMQVLLLLWAAGLLPVVVWFLRILTWLEAPLCLMLDVTAALLVWWSPNWPRIVLVFEDGDVSEEESPLSGDGERHSSFIV
jgi:hypothetical protein